MDDSDLTSIKIFLIQTGLTYREARDALADAVKVKDAKEKVLKDYSDKLTVKPVKIPKDDDPTGRF